MLHAGSFDVTNVLSLSVSSKEPQLSGSTGKSVLVPKPAFLVMLAGGRDDYSEQRYQEGQQYQQPPAWASDSPEVQSCWRKARCYQWQFTAVCRFRSIA